MLYTVSLYLLCAYCLCSANGFLKTDAIPPEADETLQENSKDGIVPENKLPPDTEFNNSLKQSEKLAEHVKLSIWPKGEHSDGAVELLKGKLPGIEVNGENHQFDQFKSGDEDSKVVFPTRSANLAPASADMSSKSLADKSAAISINISPQEPEEGVESSEFKNESDSLKGAEVPDFHDDLKDVEKLPGTVAYNKVAAAPPVALEPTTNAPLSNGSNLGKGGSSNAVGKNTSKSTLRKSSPVHDEDSDLRDSDSNAQIYEHSEEVIGDSKNELLEVEAGIGGIVLKPHEEPQEFDLQKTDQGAGNQLHLLLETTPRVPSKATEVEESFWEDLAHTTHCLYHRCDAWGKGKKSDRRQKLRLMDHRTIPLRHRRKHDGEEPSM